jgi:phage repressor protein C with HTH and peptisase S24 domain
MSLGERIAERLRDLTMSQADLARAVGITQPSVNHLIKKGAGGSAHLHKIARVLETTPEYLLGETDDRAPIALADRRLGFRGAEVDHPGTDRAEIVWLKEVDQALGAGGGFFDGGTEERLVPFPAHWLRSSVQGQIQSLVTMPCKGTSMEPTIIDGNLCIIDTSRTKLDEQDEIWACAFAGLAVIKRLRAMPDGTVKLMSDNQAVRDEIAADGELFILGRCVNVLRST